jgi:hypothetical protein
MLRAAVIDRVEPAAAATANAYSHPLRSVVTGHFPVVRLYWLNSNRG